MLSFFISFHSIHCAIYFWDYFKIILEKWSSFRDYNRDRLYWELSHGSIFSRVTYRPEWLAENTVVCERAVSILAVHRSCAREKVHEPLGTRHCDRRYMVKYKCQPTHSIITKSCANHKLSALIFSQAGFKISMITDLSKRLCVSYQKFNYTLIEKRTSVILLLKLLC